MLKYKIRQAYRLLILFANSASPLAVGTSSLPAPVCFQNEKLTTFLKMPSVTPFSYFLPPCCYVCDVQLIINFLPNESPAGNMPADQTTALCHYPKRRARPSALMPASLDVL